MIEFIKRLKLISDGNLFLGGRMVGGWVDSGLVDGCLGKIKNIDHLSPAELKLGLS